MNPLVCSIKNEGNGTSPGGEKREGTTPVSMAFVQRLENESVVKSTHTHPHTPRAGTLIRTQTTATRTAEPDGRAHIVPSDLSSCCTSSSHKLCCCMVVLSLYNMMHDA